MLASSLMEIKSPKVAGWIAMIRIRIIATDNYLEQILEKIVGKKSQGETT